MGRGRQRRRRKTETPETSPAPPDPPRLEGEDIVTPDELDKTEPPKPPPPPVQVSELVMIPPQDVERVWPLAEELLKPELPNIDITPEMLCWMCQNHQATLWMICDDDDNAHAAMVTILSPLGRCIVAVCSGPNLWDYLGTRDQLYDWAKGAGMREVVFYGRDALVKLMPECKRAGVILRKEL